MPAEQGQDSSIGLRWGLVAAGAQVQIDPAALQFEFVDLALAVVLTPGLEGQNFQVAGKALELSQQVSYCHALSVACQARYLVLSGALAGSIDPTGNRTWNRAERMRGVRAPHRRTAHTAHRWSTWVGGVARNSGEPRSWRRTTPFL
jgi:hypothetical protein